jgi:hypothetical protein
LVRGFSGRAVWVEVAADSVSGFMGWIRGFSNRAVWVEVSAGGVSGFMGWIRGFSNRAVWLEASAGGVSGFMGWIRGFLNRAVWREGPGGACRHRAGRVLRLLAVSGIACCRFDPRAVPECPLGAKGGGSASPGSPAGGGRLFGILATRRAPGRWGEAARGIAAGQRRVAGRQEVARGVPRGGRAGGGRCWRGGESHDVDQRVRLWRLLGREMRCQRRRQLR